MSLTDEINQVLQEEERKSSRTAVKRVSSVRVRRPVKPTYFAVVAAAMIMKYKVAAPAIVLLGVAGFFVFQPLILVSLLGVVLYAYASRKLKKPEPKPINKYMQRPDHVAKLSMVTIFEEDIWRMVKKIKGTRKRLPGEDDNWNNWKDAFTEEQAAQAQHKVAEQVKKATEDFDEFYFED